MKNILTIDIGGTFTKFALARGEKTFKLVGKNKIPTEKKNHETFLESLAKIYKNFDDAEGITLSMPGLIDSKRGFCISSGALNFSNGHFVAKELKKLCGVPVSVENDANCAALAEIKSGSLVGVKNAFVLVFGTAVGGAFVCDGKIYRGNHHCAGEVSYTLKNLAVNEHSDDNFCGNNFGALAFIKNCAKILGENPENVSGEKIFELIDAHDEKITDELKNFTFGVAKMIFNLQMLFDPEIFALGGGISDKKKFIDEIQAQIDEFHKKIPVFLPKPAVVACKYHNDANLIGALYNFIS